METQNWINKKNKKMRKKIEFKGDKWGNSQNYEKILLVELNLVWFK